MEMETKFKKRKIIYIIIAVFFYTNSCTINKALDNHNIEVRDIDKINTGKLKNINASYRDFKTIFIQYINESDSCGVLPFIIKKEDAVFYIMIGDKWMDLNLHKGNILFKNTYNDSLGVNKDSLLNNIIYCVNFMNDYKITEVSSPCKSNYLIISSNSIILFYKYSSNCVTLYDDFYSKYDDNWMYRYLTK